MAFVLLTTRTSGSFKEATELLESCSSVLPWSIFLLLLCLQLAPWQSLPYSLCLQVCLTVATVTLMNASVQRWCLVLLQGVIMCYTNEARGWGEKHIQMLICGCQVPAWTLDYVSAVWLRLRLSMDNSYSTWFDTLSLSKAYIEILGLFKFIIL